MLDSFLQSVTSLSSHAMAALPRLLGAVGVLVAGWLVARLLRAVTVRLVAGLDTVWRRIILRARLEGLPDRQPPTRVVGELVFWLVLLVFVAAATRMLGIELFSAWLAQLAAWLPLLIAGLLIMLAGFVVSALARDVVVAGAGSAGLAHGDLLGRLVQGLILLTALIVGVDQIGIDVGFISIVVAVLLAGALSALALAFGLGARTHVANLLAARNLRDFYNVGDTVRVDEVEGRIVALTATTLVVETREGRALLPAGLLDERISWLRRGGGDDGTG